MNLLRCTCTQRTFRCTPGREDQFFNQEGHYWAMTVMVGPFGPPLRVLWLIGIVDYPLKVFLTLALVSRAREGWLLGLMAPFLSCVLWWTLLQPGDIVFSYDHFMHPHGPLVSGSLPSPTFFPKRKASSMRGHFHDLRRMFRDLIIF